MALKFTGGKALPMPKLVSRSGPQMVASNEAADLKSKAVALNGLLERVAKPLPVRPGRPSMPIGTRLHAAQRMVGDAIRVVLRGYSQAQAAGDVEPLVGPFREASGMLARVWPVLEDENYHSEAGAVKAVADGLARWARDVESGRIA